MGKPNSLQRLLFGSSPVSVGYRLVSSKGRQSIWNFQAFCLLLLCAYVYVSIAHYTSFRSVGFRQAERGEAFASFSLPFEYVTKSKNNREKEQSKTNQRAVGLETGFYGVYTFVYKMFVFY